MRKTRGFRLRKRLKKMFRWNFRARRKIKFLPLSNLTTGKSKPVFIISTMLKCLKRRAEKLCKTSKTGYIRVCDDPIESGKPVTAPKGYLAVYVGESAFETTTYFVPVIFFNHPQFQKLLELAEKVNGFNHPGRISIPCEVSEFEKVKKTIAASESFRWHRWSIRRRL